MDTISLTYRKIDSRTSDVWVPVRQDESRSPANAWLVAHDLYHHLTTDQGLLWEEYATLGAEYYVNHEQPNRDIERDDPLFGVLVNGFNALGRSAAGITGMALDLETCRPATAFHLPQLSSARVSRVAGWVFEHAAHSAKDQFLEMRNVDEGDEWATAWRHFSSPGVLEALMRWGYHQAKARFPDQKRVREGFSAAEALIRGFEYDFPWGRELRVTRTEYRVEAKKLPVRRPSKVAA